MTDAPLQRPQPDARTLGRGTANGVLRRHPDLYANHRATFSVDLEHVGAVSTQHQQRGST